MYQIKVNNNYQFEIEAEQDQLKMNQEVIAVDFVSLASSHAHVLYKNKSYNVEIVSESMEDKVVEIKVNGRTYHVEVRDKYDQLLKQLGLENLSANKVKETKAPMPGLVLNILVEQGQQVKKGDNLLILEAMKMENIIKSASDGTVKAILIAKGDKVDKNSLLIQFA